ncbi:MAG: trigger factor, partial [Lachnospiraceae bacterium]|nr:trigger factor [Lachnospiraceae bacterium]
MSVKVEKLEKNMAKMTIEIPVEEVEKAIDNVYKKERNRIQVPGFRKGKAPRKLIEKFYGEGVFLEEAVNDIVPGAYQNAVDENADLQIVSHPEIEYEQVEKGKPVIFTATVATRPEVKLGDYKGLEVETEPVVVTEKDIEDELKKEQEKNSVKKTIDDRPVQDGDEIQLDFDGSVDGVPFDGGKGTNYPLTIGSGTFIPGFEEQLVGVEVGGEKDVVVTFPEDYPAKDLAGKEAVFKCKVNSITVKELPELNDEFASEVSEFETLEELKADISSKLRARREETAKRTKEDALVAKAVENAVIDIPDLMLKTQQRSIMNDFANQLRQQGLAMEDYLKYTGQDEEALME